MDKYSSPVSYLWGFLCTLFGALSLDDVAIIVGIILSIATTIINWVYKKQDFLHKKTLREAFYKKHSKHRNKNNPIHFD